MSHQQQVDFCLKAKGLFPQMFFNKRVVDVGSMDINGSNKPLFWFCDYVGVDVGYGPNVDLVGRMSTIPFREESFDTVISTEVAEHDAEYVSTMQACIRVLRPGGLMVFTCATTGRPEHGTTRTDVFSSPFTTDYYQNVTEDMLRAIPGFNQAWQWVKFRTNDESHDLQFMAIKKGSKVIFRPSIITYIVASFIMFYNRRFKQHKSRLRGIIKRTGN